MRNIMIGLGLALMATTASAQTYVKGYTKKDGTYVAPHYRSSPDSSAYNNYSTRGNVNPYTGEAGTKNPYSYSSPYSYGSSSSKSDSSKSKNCTYFC